MVTPAAKREAVVHLCEAHKVSQRRACAVLTVDRSTVRYKQMNGALAGEPFKDMEKAGVRSVVMDQVIPVSYTHLTLPTIYSV